MPELDSKGATILVADDNPNNLRVVESILLEFGHEVRIALDGNAAVRSSLAKPPDMILMDVHMPKLNGYEACKQLKADERTQDIPVIFVTAIDAEFNKEAGFSVGAVDFITKPIQLEELRARMNVHLALSRLQQAQTTQTKQIQALHQQIKDKESLVLNLKKEVNSLSRELSRDEPYPEVSG